LLHNKNLPPLVPGSPLSLRKSTRQKVVPMIYKPEIVDTPSPLKRKAVELPPKPAKLARCQYYRLLFVTAVAAKQA